MTENIRVYSQNSIRIETEKGIVYVDPFQMKESPKDADFILITHDHYDHFSPEDIRKAAGEDTVMVVPENMKDKAKEAEGFVKRTVTVKPGISAEIDALELETVPAYNIKKPFHPESAGWVGYILKDGGKRIYIAGDTEDIPEMAELKDIDVALLPVNQPYTMTVEQCVRAAQTIQPKVLIPYHFGNTDLTGLPALLPGIDVRLRQMQ